MATPKMSLKLLCDKKGQRVLFAEAPKEFVDFIFHIFSLPLGTLIEFIGSEQMVGCLGKLKDSIESFHGTYLQPGVKKDNIFNPKTPFNGPVIIAHPVAQTRLCIRCLYVQIVVEAAAIEKINKGGGYVKEVVTYMVMDDLVVKPMSTISSITLINKFGVKDLSQLEEKMVTFGKEELMAYLRPKALEGISDDGQSADNHLYALEVVLYILPGLSSKTQVWWKLSCLLEAARQSPACVRLCLVCPGCLLGEAYVCDIQHCTSAARDYSDGDNACSVALRGLAAPDLLNAARQSPACVRLCLVCPGCLLGEAYVCDIRTSYISRQCTSSDGDNAAPCLPRGLAVLDLLVLAS
ncbi:hypothetical protein Tco_0414822 [Tanacetum coccineum]